jgi:amidase
MAYIGWIGTFEGQRDTRKEETTESELVRELNVLGAIPIAKVSGIVVIPRSYLRVLTE